MRGLYSSKTEIRHKIFTEIARMAYEEQSPEEVLEELPYKIIPGEVATYRDSIFLERAVVGERLRVAMGMSLRKITEHAPISKGVEPSIIEEKYYEPPLINVIKFDLQCLSGEESHDNRRMSRAVWNIHAWRSVRRRLFIWKVEDLILMSLHVSNVESAWRPVRIMRSSNRSVHVQKHVE